MARSLAERTDQLFAICQTRPFMSELAALHEMLASYLGWNWGWFCLVEATNLTVPNEIREKLELKL